MNKRLQLLIQELTGLVNLKVKENMMTPEDHRKAVQKLKSGVLATALAKVFNCGEELEDLTTEAYSRATRSQNTYIQGRLTEASLKLSEFREILNDPEIRALVDPQNELPDCMKEALNRQKRDG